MSTILGIWTDAQPDDMVACMLADKLTLYKSIWCVVDNRGTNIKLLELQMRKVLDKTTILHGVDYLYRGNEVEGKGILNSFEVNLAKKYDTDKKITEDNEDLLPNIDTVNYVLTSLEKGNVDLVFLTNPKGFLRCIRGKEYLLVNVIEIYIMGGAYNREIESSDKISELKTYTGDTSHNWSMCPKAVDELITLWKKYSKNTMYICPPGYTRSIVNGNITETNAPITFKTLKSFDEWKIISKAIDNWNSFLKTLGQKPREGLLCADIITIITLFTEKELCTAFRYVDSITFDYKNRKERVEYNRDGVCPVTINFTKDVTNIRFMMRGNIKVMEKVMNIDFDNYSDSDND